MRVYMEKYREIKGLKDADKKQFELNVLDLKP